MLNRKKIIPPKHTHHQSRHCPAIPAAAFVTAAPWAFRYANADGGTLDSAVSCAEYGAMVLRSAEYGAMVVRSAPYGATVASAGATAITPEMAALLALMVDRTARPLAPPPAALTAWATRLGGIVAGFL